MRTLLTFLLLSAAVRVAAQESRVHADLRQEGQDIKKDCGSFDLKDVASCVVTLTTDEPFHIAIGSLAPGNGVAFGIAFVEHWTPNESWRIGWNADASASSNGSYRAGLYAKFVQTPTSTGGGIVVRRPGDTSPTAPARVTIHEYPIYNVYAQVAQLDELPLVAGGDEYRERQTILGANAIYPLSRFATLEPFRLSVVGAVNGRFVNTFSGTPSLNQAASFAEFEEGVRFKPGILNGHVQLNYLATLQQFVTTAANAGTFHRWTLDLKHEFPLYRTVSSTGPRDINGPDECALSLGGNCPPLTYSRNREGSITFRLLASKSMAGDGSAVPFYFQPTLGGSDINGQRLLSGYDDYQFRGANLFILQEGIEHSLWGPVGIYAVAEQGTVSQEGAGLTASDFSNSFGIGFTLRAGGFPLVNLTFAWGGGGHHIIGTLDPTLLGGSPRPSLY